VQHLVHGVSSYRPLNTAKDDDLERSQYYDQLGSYGDDDPENDFWANASSIL
jgi:hypothetical protein